MKLLDQMRNEIRFRHLSIRTEKSYIDWVKRFIFFHDKKHPDQMGEAEIKVFLNWLATQRNVAASTQNQALCSLWIWGCLFAACYWSKISQRPS